MLNTQLPTPRQLSAPLIICAFALILSGCSRDTDSQHEAARSLAISVLSTRPDMVSGGDALVRIDSSGIDLANVQIVLNDRDISTDFAPSVDSHSLQGLVEGLEDGPNTLEAMDGAGSARSQITLLNHPITGPIISGPAIEPFVCTTQDNGLGEALDDACTAVTQVRYFYNNVEGEFNEIADITAPYPSDMSTVQLTGAAPIPFLVRVESGTINRSIYHLAVLDNPQKTYGEWDPESSWNERLLFSFGGGCGTNYNQGSRPLASVLDASVLAKGFAHMLSSFNVMGHQCNDNLSAETLMMLKEHFIENYGLPAWTVGSGASGGAIQQLLITQNYPGLLNGLMPSMSFADSFSVRPGVTDCRLLKHYFDTSELDWTEEKQLAVEGFSKGTCAAWERSYIDVIVADTGCGIAQELVYNAQTNPTGARCTIYDTNIASIGHDPDTGFAYQALDNVGIQYGLTALEDGMISVQEFIDLNAHIGGYDRDGKPAELRTHGQLPGVEAAYRTGRVNQGSGGLADVPILHFRPYNDPLGDIHDRFRDFQIRARLRKANGSADNQVIWIYADRAMGSEVSALALETMTQWLDSLLADTSQEPLLTRIVNAKPAAAVDACWDPQGKRIEEPFEFMAPGLCNEFYPSHRNPRLAAGAPLEDDAIKCALQTPVKSQYSVTFTDEQWQNLLATFAQGVCDYSIAGPGQVPIGGTFLRLPL